MGLCMDTSKTNAPKATNRLSFSRLTGGDTESLYGLMSSPEVMRYLL